VTYRDAQSGHEEVSMQDRILTLAFAALLFVTPLLGQQRQQRDVPPLTAPGASIGAVVSDSPTGQSIIVVTDVPRGTPAEKAGLKKDTGQAASAHYHARHALSLVHSVAP